MGIVQRVRNEARQTSYLLRAGLTLRRIHKNKQHTFADTIERLALEKPDAVAIHGDGGSLTYAQYNAAANQYARWARAQGIGRGDAVAVLMENKPEFLVAWLGIIKVGGVAALINTNLTGQPLAHSLQISGARHLILDAALADNYASATDLLETPLEVWATDGHVQGSHDLHAALQGLPRAPLGPEARAGLTTDDKCLYIYTSGTTGSPKAANISHHRLQVMIHAFKLATGVREKDRMLIVLPLYHSAGGICALAPLLVGGSVIIRRRFSAREFWSDAVRFEATLFQYIGELCRYLLNVPPCEEERRHRIRLAIGNGLRPDIWTDFKERFRIPEIMEFYGATEGNIAMLNVDGKPGAVGRIPGWMRRFTNMEIVRFDVDAEEPVRDPGGLCIKCAPGEAGEVIGKITGADDPTGRFEGYASRADTEKKILRNVFEEGDAWFRSGDLLKQDGQGYFYFIDRIGDTFRWKGENVATSEVSEVVSVFPGVREVNVYGVQVPGADGRAGMASIVADGDLDLAALHAHLQTQLAAYARPLFIRLRGRISTTATFKHLKRELVEEGFDPARVTDPMFFNDASTNAFVPLDAALHDRITAGDMRV